MSFNVTSIQSNTKLISWVDLVLNWCPTISFIFLYMSTTWWANWKNVPILTKTFQQILQWSLLKWYLTQFLWAYVLGMDAYDFTHQQLYLRFGNGSTLFDCQMNKRRCRAKKVSTFLREIFVRARREKSLKSCWWFPGEVLVDRPWEFGGVVNPGFCCISHPPTFPHTSCTSPPSE